MWRGVRWTVVDNESTRWQQIVGASNPLPKSDYTRIFPPSHNRGMGFLPSHFSLRFYSLSVFAAYRLALFLSMGCSFTGFLFPRMVLWKVLSPQYCFSALASCNHRRSRSSCSFVFVTRGATASTELEYTIRRLIPQIQCILGFMQRDAMHSRLSNCTCTIELASIGPILISTSATRNTDEPLLSPQGFAAVGTRHRPVLV